MKINKGIQKKAQKVVIYGPEGVGKSTLAMQCPEPLFIDVEGSTNHLDVMRVEDVPQTIEDFKQIIRDLVVDPSICRTLVIDTADWFEKIVINDLCKQNKWKSIESLGYGKGYTVLKEEFEKILSILDAVISKDINVVFTAHAIMRKQELPNEEGSFDRWELKLTKQCAPLLKEWADALLFCNYETILTGDGDKKKAHGSKRVIYTQHHACWDAKNRIGLDYKLPMEFKSIADCVPAIGKVAPVPSTATTPEEILEEIAVNPADIVPEAKPKKTKKKAEVVLEKASEMGIAVAVHAAYDGIDERLVSEMKKHVLKPQQVTSKLKELGYDIQDLRTIDSATADWVLSVMPQLAEKINSSNLPFEI